MITSLFISVSALLAGQATDAPTQPFVAPVVVKNVDRLALTPKIDGVIAPEEWDAFTSADGCDAFFQWAPREVFCAGVLPVGKEFIASIDLKGDGWLVGKDNIEIRSTWDGTAAKTKIRILDATQANGPAWIDAAGWEQCLKVAATATPTTWTIELGLVDPGNKILTKNGGHKVGIRFDALAAPQTDYAPYLPRVTAPVTLGFERGINLIGGFKWKPEFKGRSVVPGGDLKMRFTFNGTDSLSMKRIECRTEGLAEAETTLKAQPFPKFDNKGRAFVDYNTGVGKEAESGYRIVRASIQNSQGEPTLLQASYEIAPTVSFDLMIPDKLASNAKAQTVKVSVYIRSNVLGKLDGTFVAVPPTGWTISKGSDKPFLIYASRGSVRKVFDLTIPADAKGTFPVKLVADFGRGKVVEDVIYLELK